MKSLKQLAHNTLQVSGVHRLIRLVRDSKLAIVMYHGVTPERTTVRNWCQVPEHEFREQMAFLNDAYKILPLDEVVDCLERKAALPKRAACITFDDGFKNNYSTAYPILKELNIPATIFLVTNLVGTHLAAWPDRLYYAITRTEQPELSFLGDRLLIASPSEKAAAYAQVVESLKEMELGNKDDALRRIEVDLMGREAGVEPDASVALLNWEQIDEMSKGGLIRFGSHTHTHEILVRCDAEKQREELLLSRDVLMDRLGYATTLAYPNGDFSKVTIELAKKLGYRAALTTQHGLNTVDTDLYELKRIGIGVGDKPSVFKTRMLGF